MSYSTNMAGLDLFTAAASCPQQPKATAPMPKAAVSPQQPKATAPRPKAAVSPQQPKATASQPVKPKARQSRHRSLIS